MRWEISPKKSLEDCLQEAVLNDEGDQWISVHGRRRMSAADWLDNFQSLEVDQNKVTTYECWRNRDTGAIERVSVMYDGGSVVPLLQKMQTPLFLRILRKGRV